MPPALAYFSLARFAALAGERRNIGIGALVLLHLAGLGILLWTEDDFVARFIFLLTWGLLNCVWLVVLRRPAISAGLSLTMVVILILLSQFKQDVLFMSANFVDIMLIDHDTVSFLLKIFPRLQGTIAAAAALVVPLLAIAWWFDPFRVRRWKTALGALLCFAALWIVSLTYPMDREKAFESTNYVSQFARSGALAAVDLTTRGVLESDQFARGHLPAGSAENCPAPKKLPHIIMVLDESSFDISVVKGVKVSPHYQDHFKSFDGKTRGLTVEGAGGPTWYTEYNVLTGLSARSYGRFAEFVTRIAAGRVTRSLPNALRPCGYTSYSLYPWRGAFLSARYFQKTVGIDHFLDAKDLGTLDVEPDSVYYDFTANLIKRERSHGPMFVLTYLMANHFPWFSRFHEERAPEWRDLGNATVDGHGIDEYLRRQYLSKQDYQAFVARLKRDFPNEPFLIVRFGDHQPLFAKKIIDPTLDDPGIGRRIDAVDPRFFTTYYSIDTVNFRPADLSSALDGLDSAYLPLVVLEAAGVPLDPSFAEQHHILKTCNGLFYLCNGGAQVRRFNRLLIDAGLIKQL